MKNCQYTEFAILHGNLGKVTISHFLEYICTVKRTLYKSIHLSHMKFPWAQRVALY